jgi:AraC-like DNA-binding protein
VDSGLDRRAETHFWVHGRPLPEVRLGETTDRITTIAEDCGFSDEEQMRSAFVRVLGVPPREYRKHFPLT